MFLRRWRQPALLAEVGAETDDGLGEPVPHASLFDQTMQRLAFLHQQEDAQADEAGAFLRRFHQVGTSALEHTMSDSQDIGSCGNALRGYDQAWAEIKEVALRRFGRRAVERALRNMGLAEEALRLPWR